MAKLKTLTDWRFAGILTLLLGTVAVSAMSESRPLRPLSRPLEKIPAQLGRWQATGEETLGAEVLKVLKPTSYLSRFYGGDSQRLGLFIAYYDRQTAGGTLHSPRNCLPGSGWEIWQQSSLKVAGAGDVIINRYSIRNLNQKMVMYYWYQSTDRIVASELAGKVYLVHDALFRQQTAAALVRLILPDTASSDEEAIDFSARVIPEIRACFGR